jgi:signal transduction histidine kinase
MSLDAPPRTLRVLHLEDSELDHALTLAQLQRGGVDVEMLRVDAEPEFLRALDLEWDAVISDYNLPGFSGLVALDLLKAHESGIPFLLLSGEIGEDAAVEAMRNGAADYLLKNNMARLVPALLHAVEAYDTRRARLAADRELGESKQRLRELAQHLQTSVEHERAAIAREIHDDVGGSLTALNFDLAWIARHTDSPAVRQRVASAQETVAHAIEASQRVMHNLRPAILEQGLVAALQWMTSRFERRTGIACSFTSDHEAIALPVGVPLVAYRTAQEALTNVSKHARATRVSIELTVAGGALTLEVADDGRGLSREDLAKARSFGIRGLHERASTVGGWVDLTSSGRGTTLILSVPLPADALVVDDDAALAAERELVDAHDEHDPSNWGGL